MTDLLVGVLIGMMVIVLLDVAACLLLAVIGSKEDFFGTDGIKRL